MLLRDVIKSLFSKPATSRYPFTKERPPGRLRGKIIWNENKCIRCLTCVRVCPTTACRFNRAGKGKIELDFGLCCWCYHCVSHCPTGALQRTSEFELATQYKNKLKS